MTGSEGVSFLFPQDFFSQQRLWIKHHVDTRRERGGMIYGVEGETSNSLVEKCVANVTLEIWGGNKLRMTKYKDLLKS